MKRIGLISDTHSFLDKKVFQHFEACDEVWHCGDVGNIVVWEELEKFKPLRGVYGNIDGDKIRRVLKEEEIFMCEQIKIFMIHIGGYPKKYPSHIKSKLEAIKPQLFLCGHSHILKIMYDHDYKLLHINPGAAGKQGWHKVRTLVRFSIDGDNIKDAEIIELKDSAGH